MTTNFFLWDKYNFYGDFIHKNPITKAIIKQIGSMDYFIEFE